MKVSLFYCSICNIACEHCFLDKSLPGIRMEDSLFQKILRELYLAKDSIRLISISGGEAMLFLDEIAAMIDEIDLKHELTFSIATNAFWAVSKEKAEGVCEKLIASNIKRLEISYDIFHAKFIDLGNVYNAVEACKKYGITVYIIFSAANGYDYLPLYIKCCKIVNKEQIILQHVANYGNARRNKVNCMLPINMFKNQKCNQVLNPCIDYNANFYACCGANILSQSSPMLVGNICEDSFAVLVDKMNKSELYHKILNKGPLQSMLDVDNVKECSSLCELCECL